ncbi:serine hydrolase [Aurantiacibacter gangjinensis]|uniref:Beta-lactamase class A catalytic domain-containing protein n=1 Tax=Aurantiacibacter gangjinensis TaxID=502682 RepID=A0A0G9MU67_9SPHN|nr:serine hydrolase [Aurantiacibacter gangjinensis]APE28736.1 putative beta-lactamase [Aurantiacibacter gangjinensis]KLE32893.1 hypothetical protein AAW01_02430 [Aurantiacibacter gangjinensis]
MPRLFLAATALSLMSVPVYGQSVEGAEAQAEAIHSDNEQRLGQRAEDIADVLRGDRAPEDVFSDAFLNQVSAAQMVAMTSQLEAQFGSFVGLESMTPDDADGFALVTYRFEQALASGHIQIAADDAFMVDTLLLNQIEPVTDSDTPIAQQVADLPGTASILLASLDGSDMVFEHNADTPLALGSAFKLYVLSTLVQEIAAGERSWSDTVQLSTASFPSGTMQDWPRGAPVTLHTLATMMISISDNTATDQLIQVLGREAIEAEMRAAGNSAMDRNMPFMTTRELFLLKAAENSGMDTYADLDRAGRLAVLESLADRDVALDRVRQTFSGNPVRIDLEWFASARDMGELFERISGDPVALDIMAVNTALPDSATEGWEYVGYKGGSEPGVLNMSWLLQNAEGRFYVLSLGWNNPEAPVNTGELLSLASSALAAHRGTGESD